MALPRPSHDVRTIKALLTGAEAQAGQAGEGLPGAEHLLLSALALPDGSARRIFERLGADPDGLRAAIDEAHASSLRAVGVEPLTDDRLPASAAHLPPPPKGAMHMNASAREAFQAAVALAKAGRPGRLVGAHVVLAVADMEHGTAARALRCMGIDQQVLVATARAELDTVPR